MSTFETEAWLTIITVVKDDKQGFRATLESIVGQVLDGVEFVVIDGSSDRDAVPAALAEFPQVAAHYAWFAPAGIYPAMNAGLAHAHGQYIHFANAGDLLHDADVLRKVRLALSATAPAWAFGQVEIRERDGSRTITPRWDYAHERRLGFSRGLFPPHQGTFAMRERLQALGGFDASFTIAADYAAFLGLSRTDDPLVLDLVIASFVEGGVSTTNWQESFRQFHRARISILQPRGLMRVRELAETAWHFGRVWTYRSVVSRVRR